MLKKFTAAGFSIGVLVSMLLLLIYWVILRPLHVSLSG